MKARVPNIKDFVKERNEALFSLDEEKIKTFIKKYGLRVSENPKIFWASVYKAVYNITTTPPEIKEKAKKWLDENGMSTEVF